MSIEKIHDLIDQAPAVSQWWLSNKKSLKWWAGGVNAVQGSLSVIYIMNLITAIPLTLGWVFNVLPADLHWMLITTVLGAFSSLLAYRFSTKMWPKRFTHNGLNLRDSVRDTTVTLDLTHEVLSQAVKISDPQMKPILARLHALKDTDLPKCWWDALAHEVDKCIVVPQPVNKSVQEKLDAVYIQIEDIATFPSTPASAPRVLKL